MNIGYKKDMRYGYSGQSLRNQIQNVGAIASSSFGCGAVDHNFTPHCPVHG